MTFEPEVRLDERVNFDEKRASLNVRVKEFIQKYFF